MVDFRRKAEARPRTLAEAFTDTLCMVLKVWARASTLPSPAVFTLSLAASRTSGVRLWMALAICAGEAEERSGMIFARICASTPVRA